MSKIHVSNGNTKVKCNCFALPSTVTCKEGLKCEKICYAKKAERMYKNTRIARTRNHQATVKKSFVQDMCKELSKKKHRITRVHEGGDFYSLEYVRKWFDIAKRMPDMQFYAYTKRNDIFTKKVLASKPANFRIHWSVDGIRADNEDVSKEVKARLAQGYDLVAVMRETKTSCLNQINKDLGCMTDCKLCLDKSGVIEFKKH